MVRQRALGNPAFALATLTLVYVLLAMARPVDHDESQYVAAAALTGQGLVPYRDYAYLQTPLQPFAFAPVAALFGTFAYPALRIVNALLGVVIVAASFVAMRRSGVSPRLALACCGLLATCDILLFSAGTARNDALPGALLALALPIIVDPARGSRARAVLAGLLLASAAAAKISFALPAVAYGLYALFDRRHRPGWVVVGTLPVVALVAATFAASPFGLLYGTFIFPAIAPSEYYVGQGRAWKLSQSSKAIDTIKFLALGPALFALACVVGLRARGRLTLLDWMILAGLVAAVLPSPTWRQYFLPLLPPLFVRLAHLWQVRPPARLLRVAAVVFATAGLAPSIEALAKGEPTMIAVVREGTALRSAMNAVRLDGPVATLGPQFVPASGRAIDPRFATGPFHFRSIGIVGEEEEVPLNLVSRRTIAWRLAGAPPRAVLIGGEGRWTSGDPALDRILEAWAIGQGWQRVPLASDRFRLYAPPQATLRAGPSISD